MTFATRWSLLGLPLVLQLDFFTGPCWTECLPGGPRENAARTSYAHGVWRVGNRRPASAMPFPENRVLYGPTPVRSRGVASVIARAGAAYRD